MSRRKRHIQLTLDQARKTDGKHGGWRPNAGRPRKAGSISHDKRLALSSRFPQHVTLRLEAGLPSIAREWLMTTIRRCIRAAHTRCFRIVEFNVLSNHLHLITEAASAEMLGRGIQGFAVRLARNLNSALKRRGRLFAHRYHARYLQTPTETRNALRYVLLNRKHHDAEKRFGRTWFDPYSSAAWFPGWSTSLRLDTGWKRDVVEQERPNARATTWLLTTGWKLLGLLRIDDAPA